MLVNSVLVVADGTFGLVSWRACGETAMGNGVAEPKERDIYTRPPRDPKKKMFDNRMLANVFVKGIMLFLAVMVVYFYTKGIGLSAIEVQTYAFSAWMFGYIALAFVSRSDRKPISVIGIFSNRVIDLWAVVSVAFLLAVVYVPFLRSGFNLAALGIGGLALVGLVSVAIVGLLEVKKYLSDESGPAL